MLTMNEQFYLVRNISYLTMSVLHLNFWSWELKD